MDNAAQIAALQKKLKAIEAYCAGWKKCQDGSYEMALCNSGYDRVYAEIKALHEQATK